jgi:Bacterial tandem repeat domain 1
MSSYYAGLWKQETGVEYYWSTSDLKSFLNWQQEMFNKGFYITALQIYAEGGQIIHSAVAHAGSGAQWIQAATDWSTFAKWTDDLFKKGFHLTSFSSTVLNGQVLYAGVVHPASGGQWVQPATDLSTFSRWSANLATEGFQLTSLSLCVLNGEVQYSGVMHRILFGNLLPTQFHPAADVKTFLAWSDELSKKGYRVTSLSSCVVAQQVMYSGVMKPETGNHWTSLPLAWPDFQALENKMLGQGFHMAALLVSEILPSTRTWQIAPFTCGKVDFNGGSIVAQADGAWAFYGSVHDNSFWYGDNWALGFVFGKSGHGCTVSGKLGAEISGPAVDGSFNKSGKDPWISQNWETVFESGIHCTMNVDPDPVQLLNGVINDLEKYGSTVVQLVGEVTA